MITVLYRVSIEIFELPFDPITHQVCLNVYYARR
jgi:hypothetical protein